jgi:hypothetical protein
LILIKCRIVNNGVHNVTTSTATSSEPATSESRGATIIPFPVREPVAPDATAPATAALDPRERLARALANLNTALEEQRVAMAAWRTVMGELKTSTNDLGDSLQRYHASLGTLGDSVSALRNKALSLEQWADNVIAKQT